MRKLKIITPAAVFLAVALTMALRPGLETEDITRKAVGCIALHNTPAGQYSWISSNQVLIATFLRGGSEVVELDGPGWAAARLDRLSREFDSLSKGGLNPSWAVSPDGRQIIVAGYSRQGDPDRTIRTLGFSGEVLDSDVNSASKPLGRAGAYWAPGSKVWMVIGHSNSCTVGVWSLSGGRGFASATLHTNLWIPLGFASSDSFLLMEATSPGQTCRRIAEFSLRERKVGLKYTVRLPFRCDVRAVELSPSGRNLLWEVQRVKHLPRLEFVSRFPFLTASKELCPPAAWISDAEGTRFVCLGRLPPGAAALRWSADEAQISFLHQARIWCVPVDAQLTRAEEAPY